MNAEVKWLVDLNLFVVVVIHGTNLQFKVGNFLEATSEMKTPDSSFIHDLELISFVAFNDLVLDVFLSRKMYIVYYGCKKTVQRN